MLIVFCIAVNVVLVSGSSLSDQVHQKPPHIQINRGQQAKIDCSHSIDTYNRIFWYKQTKDGQLQFLGYMFTNIDNPESGLNVKMSGNANKGQTCTLTIEKLNSSAVYFCAASTRVGEPAYFGQGTKLTVLDGTTTITEPTVKVLKPSKYECKSKKDSKRRKTLVCVASGFYPDHVSVSWEVDGSEVLEGVATDNEALQGDDNYYTITSRLRVPADHWFTLGKDFTCIVTFYDGKNYIKKSDTVRGVQGNKGALTRDSYVWLTQAGKLSYTVVIVKGCIYGAFVGYLVWKLQGSGGKQKR